jgi:hypothetical protein
VRVSGRLRCGGRGEAGAAVLSWGVGAGEGAGCSGGVACRICAPPTHVPPCHDPLLSSVALPRSEKLGHLPCLVVTHKSSTVCFPHNFTVSPTPLPRTHNLLHTHRPAKQLPPPLSHNHTHTLAHTLPMQLPPPLSHNHTHTLAHTLPMQLAAPGNSHGEHEARGLRVCRGAPQGHHPPRRGDRQGQPLPPARTPSSTLLKCPVLALLGRALVILTQPSPRLCERFARSCIPHPASHAHAASPHAPPPSR